MAISVSDLKRGYDRIEPACRVARAVCGRRSLMSTAGWRRRHLCEFSPCKSRTFSRRARDGAGVARNQKILWLTRAQNRFQKPTIGRKFHRTQRTSRAAALREGQHGALHRRTVGRRSRRRRAAAARRRVRCVASSSCPSESLRRRRLPVLAGARVYSQIRDVDTRMASHTGTALPRMLNTGGSVNNIQYNTRFTY